MYSSAMVGPGHRRCVTQRGAARRCAARRGELNDHNQSAVCRIALSGVFIRTRRRMLPVGGNFVESRRIASRRYGLVISRGSMPDEAWIVTSGRYSEPLYHFKVGNPDSHLWGIFDIVNLPDLPRRSVQLTIPSSFLQWQDQKFQCYRKLNIKQGYVECNLYDNL